MIDIIESWKGKTVENEECRPRPCSTDRGGMSCGVSQQGRPEESERRRAPVKYAIVNGPLEREKFQLMQQDKVNIKMKS